MVQVLYLAAVFILAHYGPPSTETPTTITTAVWCHKKQMNSFNKYLLLVTIETDDNYLIRFEMKNTIRTALIKPQSTNRCPEGRTNECISVWLDFSWF